MGISLAALLWATQTGGKSEDVSQGYSGLLYAIPIINTVIMPLGTAVLASRLWDLESKEKCCRILLTLQSRASLFFGKAAAALQVPASAAANAVVAVSAFAIMSVISVFFINFLL